MTIGGCGHFEGRPTAVEGQCEAEERAAILFGCAENGDLAERCLGIEGESETVVDHRAVDDMLEDTLPIFHSSRHVRRAHRARDGHGLVWCRLRRSCVWSGVVG